MRHRNTIMILAPLLGLACGSGPGYVLSDVAPPTSPAHASSNFDALVDDYLDFYYRTYPGEGTWSGYHRYDGSLFDFRQTSIQKSVVAFQRFANLLRAIHVADLTFAQQVDHEILTNHIQTQIFELEELRRWATNPMVYDDEVIFGLHELVETDFAPLKDRLKVIVSRLEAVPAVLAAARANLKTVSREITETVLADSETKLAFLSSYLPEAVRGAEDAGLLGRFKKVNEVASGELRDFYGFLKNQLLPKADVPFALGYERFVTLLKLTEMVDAPVEQLLELGESELRASQERFLESVGAFGANVPTADALQKLRDDHGAPETLLDDVTATVDRLRQFIFRKRLADLSGTDDLRVVEMPPYLFGFAASHLPGPFERAATGASFYVQPIDTGTDEKASEEQLQSFPRTKIILTAMHETFPGRFLQNSRLRHCASKVRRAFQSYAFTAGWAHYGEELMIEQGFDEKENPPLLKLATRHDELLRVCRFLVAIKMHTQGMTVEEATQFFVKEGYQDEAVAKQEAVRGTYDPMYLSFTLGKLMLRKLRDDMNRARGDAFSLLEFHNQVLAEGAPPIPACASCLPDSHDSVLPAPAPAPAPRPQREPPPTATHAREAPPTKAK
ncbi:MAG: DUF885 domain-containing protein [Planctomycetota bacterium]